MILNGVIALILCYFTEFNSFESTLRKSGWRYTQTFCNRKAKSI